MTSENLKALHKQTLELRRTVDAVLQLSRGRNLQLPVNLRNVLIQARNTAESLRYQIELEAVLRGNPFPKAARR